MGTGQRGRQWRVWTTVIVICLGVVGCNFLKDDKNPIVPTDAANITTFANFYASGSSAETFDAVQNKGELQVHVPIAGDYLVTYMTPLGTFEIVLRATGNVLLHIGLQPDDIVYRATIQQGQLTETALQSLNVRQFEHVALYVYPGCTTCSSVQDVFLPEADSQQLITMPGDFVSPYEGDGGAGIYIDSDHWTIDKSSMKVTSPKDDCDPYVEYEHSGDYKWIGGCKYQGSEDEVRGDFHYDYEAKVLSRDNNSKGFLLKAKGVKCSWNLQYDGGNGYENDNYHLHMIECTLDSKNASITPFGGACSTAFSVSIDSQQYGVMLKPTCK